MTTYKPAKNAQEQIEYLKTNKKITFNSIHEQQARDYKCQLKNVQF